eukprot:g20208.t1
MPNGFAFGTWSSGPGPGPMADASPLSVLVEPWVPHCEWQEADVLNHAPLIPPPDAPPGAKAFLQDFGEKAIQKELPPEVTGQEECLILD